MKKKYQGSTRVKRAQLQAIRRDFETLQMKNGESVTDYFGRVVGIANKMRIHDDKIKDGAVVEKILRSMAPKFNYIVCSIEESNDIDEMSIDELQSSLLVHEQRLNRCTSEEQALKASTFVESTSSRERGRGRGRVRGRSARGNRDGSRQREYFKRDDDHSQFQNKRRGQVDKSKIECYRRGNHGHYSNKCYTKMPKDKEK
ncbi:uncharacterized protein LOC114272136 [Camellia sinensis]|uniref:uncharacterized protein LOC114272136 n=1 Tax=Camellia sinensis TaxID=4442 RepID=UPI001035E6EB|nr:uncharacterized protein LOC114272136 [Camellia sinensis]